MVRVNASPSPPFRLLSSLFLKVNFRNLMWMFLNGYKGSEDPLSDDLGVNSLENGGDTVGVPEGIYTASA